MLFTHNFKQAKLVSYSVLLVQNLTFLSSITVWLLTLNMHCGGAMRAKLDLYQGNTKFSVNTKDCPAGILTSEPTNYTCTCLTGVWAFYRKYCAEPFAVLGGDNFCVRLPRGKLSQAMIFGNPKYPFEPSLSHFAGKFYQMEKFFLSDDDSVDLDGDSTFITITNVSWTLHGDTGTSMCLKATKSGSRIFCRFGWESVTARFKLNWSIIVKIQRGCFGNLTYLADTCYRILPPNDISVCADNNNTSDEHWLRLPQHRLKDKFEANSSEVWFPLPKHPKNKSSSSEIWFPLPKHPKNKSSSSEIWFPLPKHPKNKSSSSEIWFPLPKHPKNKSKADSLEIWFPLPKRPKIKSKSKADSSEVWFPLPKSQNSKNKSNEDTSWWVPLPKHSSSTPNNTETTTVEPITTTTTEKEEECPKGLTREAVKKYWVSSANAPCATSITEAVFTDQLRRFATLQMDKIMESRLRSLQQVEILMNISLKIMEKTCPSEIVSSEFLNVALNAFLMFVKEDFFYGVEEAGREKFQRIQTDLEKCLAESTPFAFETVSLDCEFNQITEAMILPGRRKVLTVPQTDASDSFEPIIESAWKIFLNVHTYCYQHFRYPNDHHHFSVFIMGAFTKSIYEKWIEPLENKELYSLILPNFKYMKETMKNIDYCVAAANTFSSCPVWLERSSSIRGLANRKRKKRQIWVTHISDDRKRASIWNGVAFCLQKMDEPEFKLGFGRCSHPL